MVVNVNWEFETTAHATPNPLQITASLLPHTTHSAVASEKRECMSSCLATACPGSMVDPFPIPGSKLPGSNLETIRIYGVYLGHRERG